MPATGEIDREKAKQVAQQILGDVASAMHSAMNFIGDRLGLFKAMKDAGPLTVAQLAEKTGLNQRYLQEWLNAMAAVWAARVRSELNTAVIPSLVRRCPS